MPKIISNLQSTIIEKGKEILQTKGYKGFTIRAVAKECNVAVGTIYNYYPSKESLIARIMLNDWQKQIKKIKESQKFSIDCYNTLKIVYDALAGFQRRCKTTWGDFANIDTVQCELKSALTSELSEIVHSILLYFPVNMSPDPTDFITETLIIEAAKDNVSYDDFGTFIDRIVKL